MKNLLLYLLMIPILSLSQSYNGPESVEQNQFTGGYFISNSSNGQILGLNNNNDLSVFVDGLENGPHGLELVEEYIGPKWVGQVLYACSGGRLYGYDETGFEVLNYNLNGSFLNGITQRISNDPNNPQTDLFITDFSTKKLYRYNIAENTHYEICSFSKNPNGVYYDSINERLLVVCWGWNAPIYEVDLITETYSTIINTGLGNLDGIAMDECGDFYVSAWSTNAIHKYSSDFFETNIIVDGLSSPADICYNSIDGVLAIPNSFNNTVDFISIDTNCNNTHLTEIKFQKNLITTFDFLGKETTNTGFQLEIYDNGSVEKKYLIK